MELHTSATMQHFVELQMKMLQLDSQIESETILKLNVEFGCSIGNYTNGIVSVSLIISGQIISVLINSDS